MAAGTALTGEALVRALAARQDAELTALLALRPDLATPAPSSLTALAARAASRPSVERALTLLDRFELAVCEALTALLPIHRAAAADLAHAVQAPEPEVRTVLRRLTELALVVDGTPVAAMVEALGPHPAGLGPPLAQLIDEPPEVSVPTTTAALDAVRTNAPEEAHRVLDALTWGPPVGTLGADSESPGVRWLLEHGVLRRLSVTQVVLPLEVGLAARGGRTHRELSRTPPVSGAPTRPDAVIAAEGARAAEESVRRVTTLLTGWSANPPVALRNGGLGVRELRRAAAAMEVTPGEAATLVELVAMAGLVAPYETGEENLWAPSLRARDWLESPLSTQWAELVQAWLTSPRTPWLVGTRNEQGALRAALEPGLERGWVQRLRVRALEGLAELGPGAAPGTAQLHDLLRWHAPRATPPEAALAAVLTEAATLGLTGAGALTGAGRALVRGEDVRAALEQDLPDPVGEVLVQGDLTGVVPGRPEPELGALLERASDVESRGSALTVRFTPASVRRALDSGMSGAELLEALRGYSRTPLPQPLEYLITDTARRHGQVRVGVAGSYVRVHDAATAEGLQNHADLSVLQLRMIAPTVLISPARPAELLEALRAAGTAPVLEDAGGAVVVGGPAGVREPGPTLGRVAGDRRPPGGRGGRRRGAPEREEAPVVVRHLDRADLEDLVGRMRAGEERAQRSAAQRAAGGPARTDPVHALALLRDAAAAGNVVELVMAGPTGRTEHRRLQPVSVDGGRVRLRDPGRDSEITVAVHRIRAVAPIPG